MILGGGNNLKRWDWDTQDRSLFSAFPYHYERISLNGSEVFSLESFESATVYIYSAKRDPLVAKIGNDELTLKVGDALQLEKSNAEIHGNGIVLVAGVKKGSRPKGFEIATSSQVVRVQKHWGHELWLNGEHSDYAFKQIFLKSGTKTSLQYHRVKSETLVLFEGKARFFYNSSGVSNDSVSAKDLGSVEFCEQTSIQVSPNTLHRVEALSDVILYEVSTAHLNDVIRVADDQNRPSGRIEEEHRNFSVLK
ncbi:MAG: Cupin 2, conserved barrel domain protein [Bacteriovoracaceae bacterium]|nr:Cupin 2, conserved barrel domain protein [Bacteriovoracaceae bacterium]